MTDDEKELKVIATKWAEIKEHIQIKMKELNNLNIEIDRLTQLNEIHEAKLLSRVGTNLTQRHFLIGNKLISVQHKSGVFMSDIVI